MGEVLHLPAATVLLVQVLKWGCVARRPGRDDRASPRLLGWTVAVCWVWYQYVAFSYGKVDHDRADFVVALALLPTVGLAHLSDQRRSEAAGFALRAVQLAAIATYFLSAWAKIRFGGWDWVNSATMVRAVVRRGTPMAQWLLEVPWTLHWFQWVLMGAELTAPVIFLLSEKWRRRVVAGWFVFHAMTYGAITIAFWPHLVMMLAFLPLERYAAWLRERLARLRGAPTSARQRTESSEDRRRDPARKDPKTVDRVECGWVGSGSEPELALATAFLATVDLSSGSPPAGGPRRLGPRERLRGHDRRRPDPPPAQAGRQHGPRAAGPARPRDRRSRCRSTTRGLRGSRRPRTTRSTCRSARATTPVPRSAPTPCSISAGSGPRPAARPARHTARPRHDLHPVAGLVADHRGLPHDADDGARRAR